jgi:hypothetical protein
MNYIYNKIRIVLYMSVISKKSFFVLEIADKKLMNQKYVAVPKPRTDTIKTLERYGAKIVQLNYIPIFGINKRIFRSILWRVNIICTFLSYYKTFSNVKNSVIFIQYPFTAALPRSIKEFFFNDLQSKGNKLIFLFHDLQSLRLPSLIKADSDKYYLEIADVCIFHSPQMSNKVREMGIKLKNEVTLEFFDYLTDMQISTISDYRNIKLIFAGNLSKSVFLRYLNLLPVNKGFEIYLYGKDYENLKTSEHIQYKGLFAADNIAAIEGNWGLVWDGSSIDSCTGEYGEYLKVNAPFKFSLYIAASRPVVVWKQSAMAQYVEKYHLGICVESLLDIPSTISALSDDELDEIIKGVSVASQKVKCGDKLINALKSVIYNIKATL